MGKFRKNPVNSHFSFSRYVGTMVAIAWTTGWLVGADCAVRYWMAIGTTAALVNLFLTMLPVAFGMWMIYRVFPRDYGPQPVTPPDSSPPEPWYRRITGGVGLVVWCAVAVFWNMAVFSVIARGAAKGQTLNILLMIPFSVIGILLLFVLFTAIAMLFDSLGQVEDKTGPPAGLEPVASRPKPQPVEASAGKSSMALMDMPIHGALLVASWFNWFLFFAFSMYWGGDAIGVLPSRDGFILKSHGHHTIVSETVWVISLFYGAATLLGTPSIWISFFARGFLKYRPKSKWYAKLGIGLFITIWCLGWFGGVGGDFVKSYMDWKNLKNPPTPQLPANPANAKQ
jgi:hypothetical protein